MCFDYKRHCLLSHWGERVTIVWCHVLSLRSPSWKFLNFFLFIFNAYNTSVGLSDLFIWMDSNDLSHWKDSLILTIVMTEKGAWKVASKRLLHVLDWRRSWFSSFWVCAPKTYPSPSSSWLSAFFLFVFVFLIRLWQWHANQPGYLLICIHSPSELPHFTAKSPNITGVLPVGFPYPLRLHLWELSQPPWAIVARVRDKTHVALYTLRTSVAALLNSAVCHVDLHPELLRPVWPVRPRSQPYISACFISQSFSVPLIALKSSLMKLTHCGITKSLTWKAVSWVRNLISCIE